MKTHRVNGIGIQEILNMVMRLVSVKLKLSNICIELHVESPLPGDEIAIGGEKLNMSNICIQLHVESPLPPEGKKCLYLRECFILFFLNYILYFYFIHVFLLLFSFNSPSSLFHSSIFFFITNSFSLLFMVSFVGD